MKMSQQTKVPRNITDTEWERHRNEFRNLYVTQRQTLAQCRNHFDKVYDFEASEKQWKTRIKKWDLGKYYKGKEAEEVASGGPAPTRIAYASNSQEDARGRAARSLKRKRARDRGSDSTNADTAGQSKLMEDEHQVGGDEQRQLVSLISRNDTFTPRPGTQMSVADEKLLFGMRNHIHEAFVQDFWENEASSMHQPGRQAARLLASELAAGRNFFESGDMHHAQLHWSRAKDCFSDASLLDTWYSETPIRLLFEIGRMVHAGHRDIAADLLASVRRSADEFLEEGETRHELFKSIADVNPDNLRELHSRAAICQYEGMNVRLEKNHKMLYETRLNRALDILYFDPQADLTTWMAPVDAMDNDLGADNPYSIYFLLLQAYRHVASESYQEADRACNDVKSRLELVRGRPDHIDMFRVGLAYRRLGRQMHSKQRYEDARRAMATAYKHLRKSKHDSAVLIEILQLQEAMAKEADDDMEVSIWSGMLESMIQQTEKQTTHRQIMGRKRSRDTSSDMEFQQFFKRSRIQELGENEDQGDMASFQCVPYASNIGPQPQTIAPFYQSPPVGQPEILENLTQSPINTFVSSRNAHFAESGNMSLPMYYASMMRHVPDTLNTEPSYNTMPVPRNETWFYNQPVSNEYIGNGFPDSLNQ